MTTTLAPFRWFLVVLVLIGMAGSAAAQERDSEPDSAYQIGPEDVLGVQVWGRADLTGSVTVDFEGRVQVPLIGEFHAEGRTAQELASDLTEKYQLLDPSIPEVLVSLVSFNSRSVTVLGAVSSPGRYGFRKIPDLWSILLEAGGATPSADLTEVQIVRKEPLDGEPQTVIVDLSDGIEDTDRSLLPTVRPKDTVVVQQSGGSPVHGDSFRVLGAVRSPGVYRVTDEETVIDALSLSGGPIQNADLRQVRLTRQTADGVVSYVLDVEGYLYEARPMSNLALLPGDTVTVPGGRSTFAAIMDTAIRLVPLAAFGLSLYFATQ